MLHFQDPYFTNSYTLHEALIQSCSTSIQGKGAYAFATKSGIIIAIIANYESSSQRTTLYNASYWGTVIVTTNPLVPINNENYKTLMIQYVFRGLYPIYYEYTYIWGVPASLWWGKVSNRGKSVCTVKDTRLDLLLGDNSTQSDNRCINETS